MPKLQSLPEPPSDAMSVSAKEAPCARKAQGCTPQPNRAIGCRYRQTFNRRLEKRRDTVLDVGVLESNQTAGHFIDARWQTSQD